MKPIVCLYCEGTDTKIAVLVKDKNGLKVLRVASLNINSSSNQHKQENVIDLEADSLVEDLAFGELESSHEMNEASIGTSDVGLLHSAIYDLKISKMDYIPIVTDPVVNFHHYEGPKDSNRKKLLAGIKSELQTSKNVIVEDGSYDIAELSGDNIYGIYLEGDISCVGLVNQLATFNKKRYLKIPTIKNAELSLAYYVSKSTKFFPEDNTLIVYIGKEYSKLLFLEGQKLKHIGTTLDIGTKNLHTYDVYFSKILLEMENGAISKLDNIILCGEDRSENLILSFFGTFPEANVTELKYDGLDLSNLQPEEVENIALYAIPLSAAIDYIDELDKQHIGVNFLPKYVQENQKFLQFGWHSWALMPFLFGAAFYFTFSSLSNIKEINRLDYEIEMLNENQKQNQELVDQITPLDYKINNFDATQKILDSAAVGSSVWNKTISNMSDFVERRRNFWITRLEPISPDEIKIAGFSLGRSVLTEFAEYNKTSVLMNINFEPLRDKSAFSFNMTLRIPPQVDSLNLK